MDKFVDALPGQCPPRPNPVWPALIGLLLAGAILAAWLVLRDAFAAGSALAEFPLGQRRKRRT